MGAFPLGSHKLQVEDQGLKQVWVIRKNGGILWWTRTFNYWDTVKKLGDFLRRRGESTLYDDAVAQGYKADVVPWKGKI